MNLNDEAEKQAALGAVRELLDGHFPEAAESADEDGAFGLSFRLRFDRSASPTRIRVSCRVARVTRDHSSGARKPTEGCPEGGTGGCRQIDCTADDPDQGKLPL